MRKLLAIALSGAILLPAPLTAAEVAEVARPAAAAAAVVPVLPASALRVPSLSGLPALPGTAVDLNLPAALPRAALAPAGAGISAIGKNLAESTAAKTPAASDIPAPERKSPSAAVSAQAQLSNAARALAPRGGSGGAAPSAAESRERAERVWSGAAPHEASSADAVTASAPAESASTGLSKPSRPPRASALLGAAALVPAPKAAGVMPAMAHWLVPLWHAAQPYVIGGSVLAATYAVHRGVRWVIEHLAKRGRWDPNSTDTARFAGTVATWAAGAAVGLHLAGASTTALITGFGVALSLAVKKTVGNVLYGVMFLVNRPFVIGEKVRIGDTMYQVEDMQLQYVTMKIIGKLAADKPDPVPAGVKLLPFKDVDPLGRDADDKGNKWLLQRVVSPGPAARENVTQLARMKYSNLAGVSITLYRPYTRGKPLPNLSDLHLDLAKVRKPKIPVVAVLDALKQSPKAAMIKAAVWLAAALAFIPLMPVIKAALAYKAVAILYPYVHGAVSFWATRQAARFLDKFVPILGEKLGWSRQAVIVVKLLTQAGTYFVGMSAAMRAMGLEWRSVATSLGATAAAISFASSDMLGNLAQAFLLRFDRPFNIGDTLRVGTDVGVVQEMNMFYVVLKVADGSHTLVPYSVIDATELDTYEGSAPDPSQKQP